MVTATLLIKDDNQEQLQTLIKEWSFNSTQNFQKVKKIVGLLRRRIKHLKFFNTICGPTRTKQKEIESMARAFDVMIVIGSKTSANTRRLYEIAKSLNKRTYRVESKKNIRREWIKGAERIGVTAGASTPQATTQEIIAYLSEHFNVTL